MRGSRRAGRLGERRVISWRSAVEPGRLAVSQPAGWAEDARHGERRRRASMRRSTSTGLNGTAGEMGTLGHRTARAWLWAVILSASAATSIEYRAQVLEGDLAVLGARSRPVIHASMSRPRSEATGSVLSTARTWLSKRVCTDSRRGHHG